jgi:hypothetical protein
VKVCSRVEALVVMLAAGLSACGPPKLFHFDGRPFALRRPIEMLSDGWLAVDSCARGRHALLEIEIDTIDVKAPGSRQQFALWIGTEQVGWVREVVVDGPVCLHIGPERVSRMDETWDKDRVLVEERCVYVVRAEFDLDRLPAPGDTVFVSDGRRILRTLWR